MVDPKTVTNFETRGHRQPHDEIGQLFRDTVAEAF